MSTNSQPLIYGLISTFLCLTMVSVDGFGQTSTNGVSDVVQTASDGGDPSIDYWNIDMERLDQLLAIVTDSFFDEADRQTVVDTILELGEMRHPDAAAALAEKLDFHMSETGVSKHDEPPAPEDEYPAVKALIRIGEAGLADIVEAVARPWEQRSETFLLNAAYTIMKITGGNEPARATIVEYAADYTGDNGARGNLKELATLIPIVVDSDPNAQTPRWEPPSELNE